MKTAIILVSNGPSVRHLAGEINTLTASMSFDSDNAELWLFYKGEKPEFMPEINLCLSCVVLIPIEAFHIPEPCLALLEQLASQRPVDLMLFASDMLGTQLATRLAYRLDGSSCLKVKTGCIKSDQIEVVKPAYGNHLSATFKLTMKPYCLSVEKLACKPARNIPIEPSLTVELKSLIALETQWIKNTTIVPDTTDNMLFDADIVLAVGQGIKSKSNFDSLKNMAKNFNAALGASRPVVMNGWANMNHLIGASGSIISPRICIAAGVSGTGYFTIGIKNSDLIVAINTDPMAPIFQAADVGIVDDLNSILIELDTIITADKKKVL